MNRPQEQPGKTTPEPAGRNERDSPVDEALDEAVEESMPASDPIAVNTEDPVELKRRNREAGEDRGE
jgi:hypothetical protein